MIDIFTQDHYLVEVFKKFTLNQAITVKQHILHCFEKLNLPSEDLLQQMLAEGLDFPATKPLSNPNISDSVIRVLLTNIFLDEKQLCDTIASFSVPEQIQCQQTISRAMQHLKQPSATLLAQLAHEGISIDQLINNKPSQVEKTLDIKRKLAEYNKTNSADIDAVKNKLNSLTKLNQAQVAAQPTAQSTKQPAENKEKLTNMVKLSISRYNLQQA